MGKGESALPPSRGGGGEGVPGCPLSLASYSYGPTSFRSNRHVVLRWLTECIMIDHASNVQMNVSNCFILIELIFFTNERAQLLYRRPSFVRDSLLLEFRYVVTLLALGPNMATTLPAFFAGNITCNILTG